MRLRRGLWSPEEDEKLKAYIKRYGIWNWSKMPEPAGLLRSGKSCRLRWMNYLRPGIKLGNFTIEENETIIRMQNMLGNRWCKIAAVMPGRTDNEIKNHWHTNLKKLLEKPAGDDGKISSSDAANNESPISSPQAGSSSTASMETCKTGPVFVENCTSFEDYWVNIYLKNEEAACVDDSKLIGSHSDMWVDPTRLISSCDIFSGESIKDDILANHCD